MANIRRERNREVNGKTVITPRSYGNVLDTILRKGGPADPRNEDTIEVINHTLSLRHPLDRVFTSKVRKMNIAFAIAEWVSLMTGIESIEFFQNFIKSYDRFSSDGVLLDGAYGSRVNWEKDGPGEGVSSQIEAVIEKLQDDIYSRRAVVSIYQREDLFGLGGKNTPCTLTYQFLFRDDHLDMIVNMRSSDMIRGVTYDLFVNTMVHEYVANRLGVKAGEHMHNAGSLHIYDSDRDLVEGIIEEDYRHPYLMNKMPEGVTKDDIKLLGEAALIVIKDISQLWVFTSRNAGWSSQEVSDYMVTLLAVMATFVFRKDESVSELVHQAQSHLINDVILKFVARMWLYPEGIDFNA